MWKQNQSCKCIKLSCLAGLLSRPPIRPSGVSATHTLITRQGSKSKSIFRRTRKCDDDTPHEAHNASKMRENEFESLSEQNPKAGVHISPLCTKGTLRDQDYKGCPSTSNLMEMADLTKPPLCRIEN